MYWSDSSKPEIDKSCEVAVHFRAGDLKSSAVGRQRWIPLDKIKEAIVETFPQSAKVCIFSEGKASQFKVLEGLNVTLHLDEPVDQTFHNLVVAPNLVMAKSSFSYTAAMLNRNDVYYVKYGKKIHDYLPDWKATKTRSKRFGRSMKDDDADDADDFIMSPPESILSISDYD